MKTQIHLDSVILHGVGGPESGAIDLIYYFLLDEFGQNVYRYIHINQIGQDLNEVILKDGRKVYINIRYPAYDDFETRSVGEKNLIRLDVMHTALVRIAEKEKKLDIDKLNAIKNRIIQNNFYFEFVCKTYINKKNKEFDAKVIVQPEMDRFNYYVLIMENERVLQKVLIYRGLTVTNYYNSFFATGKWVNTNEFILSGRANEVETKILIDKGEVEFVNLTRYPKPPLFELMKFDTPKEEKERLSKDWEHSLPPAFAAIIREADS